METNIILISALVALTSSVLTIIVTKVLDLISDKQTFKRELKRQFFAKKLEAAEKATKFYISGNNYYGMLQTSFELFINNGHIAYFSALSHEATVKCKLLWDESNDQISMINLYFDSKPITWYPIDNVSKMAIYISEFTRKDAETGELSVRLYDAKTKGQIDLIKEIEDSYTTLIIEMKHIAEELIKCIDFDKKRNAYYAEVIRNELKVHEI